MSEFKEKVGQLNALIIEGNTLQAMELFYANEVVMQENEEEAQVGKVECLAAEKDNLSKVSKVYSKLLNQAINLHQEVVFSEWEIIFTDHQGHKSQLTEVSVQQWADGLVIREKFYCQTIQSIG